MNINIRYNVLNKFMNKKRKPTLPDTGSSNRESPTPLVDTLVQCVNCKKMFNPRKNSECRYHPEIGTVGLRVSNHYDEVLYKCCGEVEKGFSPTYVSSGGCVVNKRHVTRSD